LRKYEVMLVLSPDADDGVVNGAVDRIGRVVQEQGGSVAKVDKWGKRRLAYEIRRQSEGFYVVVDCLGDPESMRELNRVLSLADEVMRFKVVVRSEDGQAGKASSGATRGSSEAARADRGGQRAPAGQGGDGGRTGTDQAVADEAAASEAADVVSEGDADRTEAGPPGQSDQAAVDEPGDQNEETVPDERTEGAVQGEP
jgi:small subunit ribosomal protein S6